MGIFFMVILIAEILDRLNMTRNLLGRYNSLYKSKDLLLDRLKMDYISTLSMAIGMILGWFISMQAIVYNGGNPILMYSLTGLMLLYYFIVMMDFYLIDKSKREAK